MDDKRLISFRENPINIGKISKPNRWGEIVVGIRKYAVFLPDGEINWAAIEEDNYGRYGICVRCGIPLKWGIETGWIHPEVDVGEYKVLRKDIELDPMFFEIDKKFTN